MKLSALRISMGMNVLSICVIVALGWHTMSISGSTAKEVDGVRFVAASSDATVSATTLNEMNAKLLACGFTVPQARQLLLSSLPRPPAEAFEYWRPALVRQLSEEVAEYAARQAQRHALVEAFGDSAADYPEFSEIFFPYADRWSYLSKAQQVALEAKLADSQRGRLTELRGSGVTALPASQTEFESVIGIAGAREYNIRESLLAQSLSNIGFDFSEQEFRSVFGILADAGSAQRSAIAARLNPMRMSDESDPVTATIKEALGEPRFGQYRKSQDPKYRVLLAAGEMYGIVRAKLDKAYEIDSDNASRIASLMKQGPVLSAEARRTIEELRAGQSQEMRELLGDEASAFYARSTAAIRGPSISAPIGAPIMVRSRLN